MARILIHSDAASDLEAIWDEDGHAAAAIGLLLTEAKSNPEILDTFTCHGFGAYQDERYSVTRWVEQQQQGRNLWALKIWELEPHYPKYRVIYAFHPQTHIHYVLGVFTRDFDYDERDARTQRVLAVYARLGIPEYK
jgi:hypothetical protein